MNRKLRQQTMIIPIRSHKVLLTLWSIAASFRWFRSVHRLLRFLEICCVTYTLLIQTISVKSAVTWPSGFGHQFSLVPISHMYSLVQSFRLGFQAVFIIFTFQCVLLLFLFLPDEAMSYFQALEVRCVYFKKWPLFITVELVGSSVVRIS